MLNRINAEVTKLVNVLSSKASAIEFACGFESRLRHQTLFNRIEMVIGLLSVSKFFVGHLIQMGGINGAK